MNKTLLFGSHSLVHPAHKLVCHHYSWSLYWDIREVRISHWLLWGAAIFHIYVRSQKSKRLVKQPLWHWDLSQYEAESTCRQRGGYRSSQFHSCAVLWHNRNGTGKAPSILLHRDLQSAASSVRVMQLLCLSYYLRVSSSVCLQHWVLFLDSGSRL